MKLMMTYDVTDQEYRVKIIEVPADAADTAMCCDPLEDRAIQSKTDSADRTVTVTMPVSDRPRLMTGKQKVEFGPENVATIYTKRP